MSEEVSQESAFSIDDIGRRLKQLAADRTFAKEQQAAQEAALEALMLEVSAKKEIVAAARIAAVKAEKRFAKIIAAFADDDDQDEDVDFDEAPPAVAAEAKPGPAAPALKAASDAKTPRNGKPVAVPSARPSAKRSEEPKKLTVPEQVAAAMGGGVWDAGALAQVLADTGAECFKSNNPRAYLSAIFNSARIRVPGPDGKPLEVRRFIVLERGRYRVATEEDIQREVRKHQGSSEVIMSENGTTPTADELFAEHGIDVRPAMDGVA